MPRQPRTHVDGYPLHIVQRGHNRERCFFADSDFRFYLDRLYAAVQDAQCALHAFVLMPNHVHLLLTPSCASKVGAVMQSVGRHYVPYVNRRYERSGSIWESRYRSSLVVTDEHLLACYRYIELNPVRARIATTPGAYRWSSYRTNAWGRAQSGLTPHATYLDLGKDDSTRQREYRSLFETALDAGTLAVLRECVHRGRPTARFAGAGRGANTKTSESALQKEGLTLSLPKEGLTLSSKRV